jgi:hypothetical protein
LELAVRWIQDGVRLLKLDAFALLIVHATVKVVWRDEIRACASQQARGFVAGAGKGSARGARIASVREPAAHKRRGTCEGW